MDAATRFNVELGHNPSANDFEWIAKGYSYGLHLKAVYQQDVWRHQNLFGDIEFINAILHSMAWNCERVVLNYASYEASTHPAKSAGG